MPKITVDVQRCKGCGLCVNACPLKIISLNTEVINPKGYHPAKLVVPEKCIGCKSCAIMCPDCAIVVEK
ncbi:MAG: 4Fe-4S binding protein [Oscillospiraceae bacterium]|jgi:2-oxoglutarate ferredoxin oxidoreductase subunit delta|nr:4Fe-4S binding protein [Oscillospiraceae bacterium]